MVESNLSGMSANAQKIYGKCVEKLNAEKSLEERQANTKAVNEEQPTNFGNWQGMVDETAGKKMRKYYHQEDCDQSDVSESELEAAGAIKFIQLSRLDIELEKAKNDDKYLLIFDKSGQAETFFQYHTKFRELHKEIIQIKLGKKLQNQVTETLRSSLVYAMKSGDCLCISSSRLEPNWRETYNNEEFPCEQIFNYEEWHRYCNYMKIVKEDENKNMQGDQGMFCMQKDFKIVLLYAYTDEEQVERVIDQVPCIEHFRVCVIEEPEKEELQLGARQAVKEAAMRDKKGGVASFMENTKHRSYELHQDTALDYYETYLKAQNREKK